MCSSSLMTCQDQDYEAGSTVQPLEPPCSYPTCFWTTLPSPLSLLAFPSTVHPPPSSQPSSELTFPSLKNKPFQISAITLSWVNSHVPVQMPLCCSVASDEIRSTSGLLLGSLMKAADTLLTPAELGTSTQCGSPPFGVLMVSGHRMGVKSAQY